MSGARGQKATAQDTGGAAEKIGRQRRGRHSQRDGVGGVERRAGKRLDADAAQRHHAEIGEAEQNRRLQEQLKAACRGWMRRSCCMRATAERVFLQRECAQHGQSRGAQREQRSAPAERAADAVAYDRGERITEAAADTVHAVGVAQAARFDVGVEHGEIRRMEDAVADAHQCHQREKPVDVRNEPGEERAAGQKPDTAQEHRSRTETIDGEAGGELTRTAGNVEHAHQRAQRGIAHGELRLEQRKQWRQRELEEVRQAVRRADQPDHPDVAAERCAVGGGSCGSQGKLLTIKANYNLRAPWHGTRWRCYPSKAYLPQYRSMRVAWRARFALPHGLWLGPGPD
jgi:hypothetical protein